MRLFLLFFTYLITKIENYLFRSSQMQGLAKKYNLNYTKPKASFLFISPSSTRKSNIIEGKINGKNVLIYDFFDYRYCSNSIDLYDFSHILSDNSTIISIDGRKKIELRGFVTGFCSVKKIDSFLAELSKEK